MNEIARGAWAVWIAIVAVGVPMIGSAGCSAILDPGRYQGGSVDAGVDGNFDGGPTPDAPPPLDGATTDGATIDGALPDGAPSDAPGADGAVGCPSSLSCKPLPVGWMGPIVLTSGPGDADAPACPAYAPSTVFSAQTELSAPTPTCGCECNRPSASQMTCGSATVRAATNCLVVGGTNLFTVADGACMGIMSLPSTGAWAATRPTFGSTGGCTPSPTANIPPATWDGAHRACGFGAPMPCTEGVCVPTTEGDARVCVYTDGAATCPADYPNALATAEDLTDTRGCSPCTCGAISGRCEGDVNIVSSCSGIPLLRASIPVGGCITASSLGTPQNAEDGWSPVGSCPPSTSTPTGGTELVTQRTVCCE